MRPFSYTKKFAHGAVRHVQRFKFAKAARRRDSIGVVQPKKLLKTAFLNIDGLSEVTLDDVSDTVKDRNLDVVFLVESKRREEESVIDAHIPGYALHEARRSNLAGDKAGGGIMVYTKLTDGVLFKRHTPDITDPEDNFINSERVWITVESLACKTAVCGMYLGYQSSTDKHGAWNDSIYRVVQQEAFMLRSKGYRVCYLADFNGHVGNKLGEGVPGNTPDINPNGRRFLSFLANTDSRHINGECRVPGQVNTMITKGLWTRQRGGHSSVIDYGVISREHMNTVVSMEIDDKGLYGGGGSDHNWIFLHLSDRFMKKRRILNSPVKKQQWNIRDDQDWSSFRDHVQKSMSTIDLSSVNNLASSISASILKALHDKIGLRSQSMVKKPCLLSPALVQEFRLQRVLEKNWKSLNSANANSSSESVALAEKVFLEQKSKTNDLLLLHRKRERSLVLDKCSGNSPRARKNFWSYVSPSVKQSSDISAVVDPVSGVIKCNPDEIRTGVEDHLLAVFNGSFETLGKPVVVKPDHSYSRSESVSHSGCLPDHTYPVNPSPCLPKIDSSSSVEFDPSGWLNASITFHDVNSMLKLMKNGKARGWDLIPNEALKNLPDDMISMIAVLFNRIKKSGDLPKGWNRGRVTLVHSRGLRELLSNYRPITVLISLCGLYSRVLNARLSTVVEEHKLLGEVQNGFRKERGSSDNSFILDTIIWKSKGKRSPLHLSFLDISKAYDSVNREILWKRLYKLGIRGEFLACLKALYNDDCIDCEVNGLLTRSIFLGRGLRQGCSLSPILFALYIADVGNDIVLAQLGFYLGSVCISGLLFADDIVLVARSAAGLQSLLALVKKGFDALKLSISSEKSQVIFTSDETWDLLDASSNVEMSLKQVALYKYLGTWTYNSMYKTGVEKQKQCVQTANKYKGSCIYVSRLGPDVVDVVLCTWLNIALPAILHGCDVIPFCESRIDDIERIQSQVAKFALGVPRSTSNCCAQTELGMKTFRQQLYERQLKFFFRVLYLPEARWVHQALLEHLSGAWTSPYLAYIESIRSKLGIFVPSPSPVVWKHLVHEFFIKNVNNEILSLPCVLPIKKFSRLSYVCESEWLAVLAEFKFGNEGLGNKQPRNGLTRKPYCPVCPIRVETSGQHLLLICTSLSKLRSDTGIYTFMNQCTWKGLSLLETYVLFVTGRDSNKVPVAVQEYLERGKCINAMRQLWLSKW